MLTFLATAKNPTRGPKALVTPTPAQAASGTAGQQSGNGTCAGQLAILGGAPRKD